MALRNAGGFDNATNSAADGPPLSHGTETQHQLPLREDWLGGYAPNQPFYPTLSRQSVIEPGGAYPSSLHTVTSAASLGSVPLGLPETPSGLLNPSDPQRSFSAYVPSPSSSGVGGAPPPPPPPPSSSSHTTDFHFNQHPTTIPTPSSTVPITYTNWQENLMSSSSLSLPMRSQQQNAPATQASTFPPSSSLGLDTPFPTPSLPGTYRGLYPADLDHETPAENSVTTPPPPEPTSFPLQPPVISNITGEPQHSYLASTPGVPSHTDIGLLQSLESPTFGETQQSKRPPRSIPRSGRSGRRIAPAGDRNWPPSSSSSWLPRYGAMGPALNYILGLDEYGEPMHPKPQKPFHHSQQQHLPHNRGYQVPVPSPEQGGETPSDYIPGKSGAPGVQVDSSVPQLHRTEPYRSAVDQVPVDFQKILQSLPPTFPLVPGPAVSPETGTHRAGGPHVPYQGGAGRPATAPRPYGDSYTSTRVTEGQPVMSSPTTPPERMLRFHPRTSPALRHFIQPVLDNRRDEFLWKLFLPQPSVPSTVSQPLTSRFDTSRMQPPAAKLASEEALPAETAAPVSGMAPATASESKPQEERLLIVVRRLPDRVVCTARRPNVTTQQSSSPRTSESTAAAASGQQRVVILDTHMPWSMDAEDVAMQSFNLEMQDVDSVSWQLDRNEFGLDFAEAFPKDMQRLVVADPSINFSHLTCDPEVQRRLRNSLRSYLREHDTIPVFVDEYEAARNEKYSEEVLAPLFHYRTPPVSTGFHYLDWSGYQELNKAFLHTIVANYRPGDWILVFNYQLMLLPKMLRESPVTREANIGFYLGTVFPSSEMYRILPQREELLRGILAATFIGFHGFQYKRHFFTACTRVLGIECSGDRIEPHADVGGGAGARVVTFPRGINPYPWLKELQKPGTQARIAELREKFKGRKVLLGIDTLDYTKGIPNKMLAFNKFLTDNPEWADKVVFFQLCVPKESTGFYQNGRVSRMDRKEILSHLYQLVGAINANFGNIVNQPVHFLLSSLTVEQLVCLYALADIVVITPLRESLSWTAYEFVLCQSYTNKGVLILSEFSGSSQSLGAAAICVNPWDPHALAAAIYDALVMKDEEKLERHEYAFNYVLTYDAQSWGYHLMQEFRDAAAEIETERRTIPQKLSIHSLAQAKQSAGTTILIFGLRGALVPASSRGVDPQLAGRARLPKRVEMALHVLASDRKTHILILSSSPVSVLAQSLSQFRNITLMAENGHVVRPGANLRRREGESAGSEGHHQDRQQASSLAEFSPTVTGVDLSWMEPVEEICRYFEQRTPGSFLYRTGTSVAWNYRGAQRDHGAIQARDLLIHLWAGPATLTAPTDIVVGPHSVEVRSSAMNKAAAVERWLRELEDAAVDVGKAMVLCAANFLPRDEDVYGVVGRIVGACSGNVEEDEEWTPECDASHDLSTTVQGETVGELPPVFSDDAFDEPDKIFTCTVGLKPSRAQYYVSDEKEFERVLTLLASLAALKQWDEDSGVSSSGLYSSDGQHLLTSTPDSTHKQLPSALSASRAVRSPPAKSRSIWKPVAEWLPSRQPMDTVESKASRVDAAALLASPELQRAVVAATYFRHAPSTGGHGASQIESQSTSRPASTARPRPGRSQLHTLTQKPGPTGPPPGHHDHDVLGSNGCLPSEVQRRGSAPGLLTGPSEAESSCARAADDTEHDIPDMKSIGAADDEGSGYDEDFDEDEEEEDDYNESDDDETVGHCDDLSTAETDRTSSSCHQYGTQTFRQSRTFYTPS